MIFCYKVLNGLTPKSLFDIIRYRMTYIPIQEHSKSEQIYTQFYSRTKSFGSTFFPFCIKEWNKLDTKIRNLSSVSKFKKSLLICSKTDENSIFDVHNPTGIFLNICTPALVISFLLNNSLIHKVWVDLINERQHKISWLK